MTVPVLRAFVEQHPDVKVTVLTKDFLTPLFDDLPNVRIYNADIKNKHKGIIGLYRLSKELKKTGINRVADLHNVLRSKILVFFFRLSNISCVQINKGRIQKRALTRPKNKIFKPLKSTHERYVDVFKGLGLSLNLNVPTFPSTIKLTSSFSSSLGIKNGNTKWIGIAPFSKHQGKAYPLDLIQEVVLNLSQEENFSVLLFGGGKSETELLDKIANSCNHRVINIAGKVKLKEELAIISNLDLMVSMDSSNGHFSAIYGVPTLTIWGVTHPYAGFRPFNQPEDLSIFPDLNKYSLIPTSIYGNKYPDNYSDVMRSIPTGKVINKIKSFLSES